MDFTPLGSVPSPPRHTLSKKYVTLLHPGYSTPSPLITLPCLDDDGNGVYFGVLLDATFVIANNTPGIFKIYKTCEVVGDKSRDDPLEAGMYTYYPDGWDDQSEPYPICLDFKQWSPPETLPEAWRTIQYKDEPLKHEYLNAPADWEVRSAVVKVADGKCLCTKQRSGLKTSRLVPRAEDAWFQHHLISHSNLGVTEPDCMSTESEGNLVTMRSDIANYIFDERHFAIVPLAQRTCHYFVQATCDDHIFAFHRRLAEVPTRVPPAFLFYRFAWCVIGLARLDVGRLQGVDRMITVPVPSGIEDMLRSSSSTDLKRKRSTASSSSTQSEMSATGPALANTTSNSKQTHAHDHVLRRAKQQEFEKRLTDRIGDEDYANELNDYEQHHRYLRLKADWIERNPSVRSCSSKEFAKELGGVDDV